MSRLKRALRKVAGAPGVPQARHVTERAVAPYLRADVHSLHQDQIALALRLESLERAFEARGARVDEQIAGMARALDNIDHHQPAVLNAISSTNGTVRLLRRELEALRGAPSSGAATASPYEALEASVQRMTVELELLRRRVEEVVADSAATDERVLDQIRPHIDTLAWLVGRVEVVRAEMMNELRYGGANTAGAAPGVVGPVEPRVINPSALAPPDGALRVNLGCGHIPLPGYVNVDIRELPGVDVIAGVDGLPFEPGSLTEIFSAHTLEHFPEEELRRRLLPYWVGLLRRGGELRAVVPDLEAMTTAYSDGAMPFEVLRSVAYGGQEYAGDFHFTGFTPATLAGLFEEAGLVNARVVASARRNGDCLECEVVATRPAG